ncbi:hypothetical protein LF1_48350 [Rubripirellula obstinata]|uniref:Squalene cyclase C-terminal domain-containing protein n=1 Tax=Rubripirellula obstinata TaxID=406547 RepID=A0A5B1CPI4_9BACT|nr:hypothetical protein [Rubripirellula obstinata]KAA1262272.1 hypothetical protein LF1_48350 [Rubripirellula obstinata]
MDVPPALTVASWLTDWLDQQKKRLIANPLCGYSKDESATAEPVAFAAITACGFGLKAPAEAACNRLLDAQNKHGSVSVRLDYQGPFWPTSLAAIAWRQFERTWEPTDWRYRDAYRNAVEFLTSFGGAKIDPDPELGHNTQLVGWPWVDGTHSWLEPTAMALLAMRQCGFAKHPRAIEAAELLLDRQLDSGGANYGNTFVLGKKLRPHVMPSAISLVALHRFKPEPQTRQSTINYLRSQINQPIAAISLAWAIHALAAVSSETTEPGVESEISFETPLKTAIDRLRLADPNPHRQNMLMLASLQDQSPLLDLGYHSLPNSREAIR